MQFGGQPLLHQLDDLAVVSTVRILQVLPDPLLDITNLWERIAGRLLACVELSEANTETDLVDISVWNQIIGCRWNGWVDKELKQSLCGQTPTLGITVNESLRLAKCLCEGHNGGLAVSGSGKLLSIGQNDCEIDGLEDATRVLAGDF